MCPLECWREGERNGGCGLTYPSARVAAGSETRSGPCLSKHTSRHMQQQLLGAGDTRQGELRQELIDKGAEQEKGARERGGVDGGQDGTQRNKMQ